MNHEIMPWAEIKSQMLNWATQAPHFSLLSSPLLSSPLLSSPLPSPPLPSPPLPFYCLIIWVSEQAGEEQRERELKNPKQAFSFQRRDHNLSQNQELNG